MANHYVPNLEEIQRAKKAGMTDREIIKLCKDDKDGDWFAANRKQCWRTGLYESKIKNQIFCRY